MFKKIKGKLLDISGVILLPLLGAIILSVILLPRLGGLVPTASEQAKLIGVDTKSQLYQDSAFLPQKVVQISLDKLDPDNVTLLRATSVVVVSISVIALYIVLSKWHTHRVALAGSLLFLTSSYVLHDARSAYQQGAYLAVIPLLLLIGTWLKSKKNVGKLPLASTIIAILLYLPGVWLFILVSSIFFWKRLLLAWRFIDTKTRILSTVLPAAILLPLAYSWARYPAQIISWIGVPDNFSAIQILKNFANIPVDLFINGPNIPAIWVVGTPILDIFTISMFILGVAAYTRGHHPLRMRLLLGYSALSCILISFGSASVGLLLPAVYIVATNGAANMLQSWFVVFPRNPFARNVGVVLMTIAILVTCRYHLVRYYYAWPSIQATKSALSVVQYK